MGASLPRVVEAAKSDIGARFREDPRRPKCPGQAAAILAALPFPAWADGRIRLAVDVSNWLRPGRGDQPGPPVLPYVRAR